MSMRRLPPRLPEAQPGRDAQAVPAGRRPCAFTLVELLVVIGIIALLIAILLPALANARWSAKETSCRSQLRQIAMAVNMYTQDHNGWYPDAPWGRADPAQVRHLGWTVNGVSNVGAFDYRGAFMRNLGVRNLNKVLKCPLASTFWYTDGRTDLHSTSNTGGTATKSTYVFYYGRDGFNPADLDANGKPKRMDGYWARSRTMLKASDFWSPASNAGRSLKFNILASDVLFWNSYAGNWIVSTHSGRNRSAGNDDAFINYTGGGKYPPGREGLANFAQTDGSVVSHKFSFNSITSKSIVALASGNQPSLSYYVPAELGR